MVTEQMIRDLAYTKWELAGYPASDGVSFWLEAESELRKEYCPQPKKRLTKPRVAAKVSVK